MCSGLPVELVSSALATAMALHVKLAKQSWLQSLDVSLCDLGDAPSQKITR